MGGYERILECLEMVELCQRFIIILEQTAAKYPNLFQEAAEVIGLEKEIINNYRQEIQCTT